MSFFGTFFGFNGNALNPSTLATNYPNLVLEDTSLTSDPAVSIANIQGALWLTYNAVWNSTTLVWDQPNIAAPSYALVLNTNGSITRYFAAAIGGVVSNPPITWTTVGLNLSSMPAVPYSFQRNKLINGAHEIDQRNSGASVTNISGTVYSVDRWIMVGTAASKFSAQQQAIAPNSGPPSAFSLLVTSLSSYSLATTDFFEIQQRVEAANVSEIAFGTAGAVPVAVSFWLKSSVIGTFTGSIRNAVASTRAYPFTISVTAANTWTQYTISIPGDVAGSWTLTGNGTGLVVALSLGAGSSFFGTANTWQNVTTAVGVSGQTNLVATSGATLNFACAQLETGSSATSFEQRLYQTELALCQRYCYVLANLATSGAPFGTCAATGGSTAFWVPIFPALMRAAPTFSASGSAANYQIGSTACNALPSANRSMAYGAEIILSVASGLSAAGAYEFSANATANLLLTFSAEL